MLNWIKKRLQKWLLADKTDAERDIDEKKRLIKGIQEYCTLVDELHSSMAKSLQKRIPSTQQNQPNQEDYWKKRAEEIRKQRF